MYISEMAVAHPDDPVLNGSPVPDALLADDIMLSSTSASGLQWKLDRMNEFFMSLGMKVNINKSKIMRLGCVLNQLASMGRPCGSTVDGAQGAETFTVEGEALEEVNQFKYIGFNIQGGKTARWQMTQYVDKCIQKD